MGRLHALEMYEGNGSWETRKYDGNINLIGGSMKKKNFVRAPVLSQSGYGEQARFALRSSRSKEDLFDIYINPIPWGQTGWIWEDNDFRKWMDERIALTAALVHDKQLQPDMSLQITIPNEFQSLLQ